MKLMDRMKRDKEAKKADLLVLCAREALEVALKCD